jgi:hypothetical protein
MSALRLKFLGVPRRIMLEAIKIAPSMPEPPKKTRYKEEGSFLMAPVLLMEIPMDEANTWIDIIEEFDEQDFEPEYIDQTLNGILDAFQENDDAPSKDEVEDDAAMKNVVDEEFREGRTSDA